jgi:protoheme IX farnesyltransferase
MNEYIERDSDKLMARTATRPLPAGRMSFVEAVMLAGAMAVAGLTLIGVYFNEVAALVGAVALISYAFLYTPLKKSGPIAVWIGAIPGALPPVIGYVCVTGQLHEVAIVLFTIQFVWQFLHFWAIAWLADSDYAKAGFRMLPSTLGKHRASAIHIVVFAILLVAAGWLPWAVGLTGLEAPVVLTVLSIPIVLLAAKLYLRLADKSARQLLLASFAYLPLALIVIVLAG